MDTGITKTNKFNTRTSVNGFSFIVGAALAFTACDAKTAANPDADVSQDAGNQTSTGPDGIVTNGGTSSNGANSGVTDRGVADSGPPPMFLVGTRIWNDTQTTSYFHTLPSLEQGTAVDMSKALEIPGSAKLYTAFNLGWFAIGSGESPTITRYTLGDRGALVRGQSMSLQPRGVKDLWPTIYFVSPTKAYYPDRATRQLIVWNPTTMEIQRSIELPQTARDGYLSLYSYTPVMRGKTLLFSVGWFDWDVNDTILAETGLVAIDMDTDTVTRFDVDKRCGGISETIVTASGDAYFVSSALAAAANKLGRLSTEPCALRVKAGETAFDSGYRLRLADVTGGAIAGEPIPAGGNSLFLRVFDQSKAKIEMGSRTWELTTQPVWSWWRLDTATSMAAQVSQLQPSSADVVWVQVENRVFGTETTKDNKETTLIDLTAAGGPRPALKVPGFLHSVARVR